MWITNYHQVSSDLFVYFQRNFTAENAKNNIYNNIYNVPKPMNKK
jgi:hypothetical protein